MDVDELRGEVLPAVVRAAQLVSRLCGSCDNDIHFYQTVYPDVAAEALRACSARLLQLAQAVHSQAAAGQRPGAPADPRELYDEVGDVLDGMLEECDHQLDVAFGRIKEPKIAVREPHAKRTRFQTAPAHLTVIRPESRAIYEPAVNPYKEAIKGLSYDAFAVPADGPVPPYRDLQETPLHWIDSEEALDTMIDSLATHAIIAVDLEHHSMHSYHGFTCLMQISTPSADYLVDAIRLRLALPRLAPVLASPAILKVMHGAESDTNWLQRDFNLFLVNIFDTFFASKALNLERFSFAHLVKRYVGLDLDKGHQMSDWRIRPLPQDMQLYARQDTHYLLFIFEHLRRELLEKSPEALAGVFARSAHQCSKLYRVERPGNDDWKAVIQGSSVPFNRAEHERVRAIHAWRDRVAQQEDVSLFALLPNPMIIRLAQSPAGADLLKLLNEARYDMRLVIKNLASLRQAMEECARFELPKPAPKALAAAAEPLHIIFKDEDGETPVPQRPLVAMASKLKPRPRKGRSMLDAFGTAASATPTLDIGPVIAQLDITKVGRAARRLQQAAEAPDEATVQAPPEAVKPVCKEAKVMRTGQVLTESQVLADAGHAFEFSLASDRKPAPAPSTVFDFASAQREASGAIEDASITASPAVKEFKPQFEAATFNGNRLGPRLSTKPRSGNRNGTFAAPSKD